MSILLTQALLFIFSTDSFYKHFSHKKVLRGILQEKQNNIKKGITLYKFKKSALSNNTHLKKNLHLQKEKETKTGKNRVKYMFYNRIALH